MPTEDQKPTILLVDDEPDVLAGLKLTLRRHYTVLSATNATAGLRELERTASIAVVVSDMRMPEIDGAMFLSKVRARWPDSTRILLTGEAGREPAIAAINDGQIFRFLTKPCSAPDLTAAVNAAYRHFQLVTGERTLLHQTLVGSIHALVDLLGIVNPVAFGRAGRVKRLCMELQKQLGQPESWELEAAALLSQVGYVSLPTVIVEKLYEGKPLSREEASRAGDASHTASKLLSRIPRLDRVASIIDMATAGAPAWPDAAGTAVLLAGDDLWALAAILSVVLEIDLLVSSGLSPPDAVSRVQAQRPARDRLLFEALSALLGDTDRVAPIREMPLREVKPGMTLLTDVRLDNGALMISRDYEISESFMQRLPNFAPSLLNKMVRVGLPRVALPRWP